MIKVDKESRTDVLYVLAQCDYFLRGVRGRVSHAKGFVSGLAACGKSVRVISGKKGDNYLPRGPLVSYLSIDSSNKLIWWVFFLSKLIREVPRSKEVIIRWRPLWFLWGGIFLIFYRRKVWFEVNALTGSDSKFFPLRMLSRFSIWLVCRLFSAIVVSETSKEKLVLGFRARRVVVVPNGFHDDVFSSFKAKVRDGAVCNLVYFGKKQAYYDWSLLLGGGEGASLLSANGVRLNIFGFEGRDTPNVVYKGAFKKQDEMLAQISLIKNPIMILPAADSDTARSGSPMKLFEYAALGVPIIVSDSLKRQASKLPNVIFYEAGNLSALSQAIADTVQLYPARLKDAEMNQRVAFEGYSWRSVVQKWVDSING